MTSLAAIIAGLYPAHWQSQLLGMKGEVATALLPLAIPHQAENISYNLLLCYNSLHELYGYSVHLKIVIWTELVQN